MNYFPERDQLGAAIWYPNAEIVRLYKDDR